MSYLKIKIPYKYFLISYNETKNKVKTILKSKKMETLKEEIKGKKVSGKNQIILLKLSKEPNFNNSDKTTDNKSGLSKLIGGPIKITFKMYQLTENMVLKLKYEPIPNRKGEPDTDKRNSQFLYITKDYYQTKGIVQEDLEKVALLAIKYKLEKRLLAPKLINQIF
jgi:hypothetical protein